MHVTSLLQQIVTMSPTQVSIMGGEQHTTGLRNAAAYVGFTEMVVVVNLSYVGHVGFTSQQQANSAMSRYDLNLWATASLTHVSARFEHSARHHLHIWCELKTD